MPEKIQDSGRNEIARDLKELAEMRIEALKEGGVSDWFCQFETQFLSGLIPNLTPEEGRLCAEKFGNLSLKELKPSSPTKTTETPIMRAIIDDIEEIFGEMVVGEIETFVVNRLMPLRGVDPDPGSTRDSGSETEPNKFLVIATENVLRDVIAVARMFQFTDEDLRTLYPDIKPDIIRQASLMNLSLSLLFRGLKGKARDDGLCRMHKEHIWMIRGLRDLPPGGLQAIGEFIDGKLSS